MKLFAAIATLALVAIPLAAAGSTSQTGTQSGNGWSESTTIAVTGGASFTLTSLTADFDIFFFDSSGRRVGQSIACGDDAGRVPATAVTGQIKKWDDLGAAADGALACTVPNLLPVGVPAQWTYTES